MKRKLTALIMATAMGLSCMVGMAGCGGNEDNTQNTGNNGGNGQTQEHTLVAHAAKDATCTEEGNRAYWECTDCGKLFSDKDGNSETTLSAVTIAAKGHTLEKTEGTSATCKNEGVITYWTCTVCHKLFSDAEGKTEIDREDTVIPVTDDHTYGEWLSDGEGHWKKCEVCGDTTEKVEHTFDSQLVCEECAYEYDPAEDTAPSTIDELFPDETSATAIELARAEYYQNVAKENLQIVYDYVYNNFLGSNADVKSYKIDLGDVTEDKIQTLTFLFSFYHLRNNVDFYMVYDVELPKALTVTEILDKSVVEDLSFTRQSVSRKYSYDYMSQEQGDKDEFVKAVAAKLDPDFDYNAPETKLICMFEGSGLDGDFPETGNTVAHWSISLINNSGVRTFYISTAYKDDVTELTQDIQKDHFKTGSFDSVDFGEYQLDVDLTAVGEEA